MISFNDVMVELTALIKPPKGVKFTIEPTTDNLLVGNDELAFCITRKAIDDNLYKAQYLGGMAALMDAMENYKPPALLPEPDFSLDEIHRAQEMINQ